jgi:two-component system, chemotaxis family, protein-glutamate methylesterase/glutaminase
MRCGSRAPVRKMGVPPCEPSLPFARFHVVTARDVIVIGASAGGVEALRALVAGLRPDLPAAVLVVVHLPATAESALPAILTRHGRLPAHRAADGDRYERGHIYVAPPDHHLLVRGDRLRLTRGPRVNGHRPAIDPLFRSAARQRGARAVGIVLSGTLDDGTAGMAAIDNAGGATIVQAPSDALYAAMPQSVLEHVDVDHAVPISEMAELLGRIAGQPVATASAETDAPDTADPLELEEPNEEELQGPPSLWTCPDCHGALWELDDAGVLRYRCHVGHAFAPDSLFAIQSDALEDAIWAAYRALRESAMLARRLADRARGQGLSSIAEQYETRHSEAMSRARVIGRVLRRGELAAEPPARPRSA